MSIWESLENVADNDWGLAFGEFKKEETSGYVCPFCGQIIANKNKVVWINKHEKSFKCPGCSEEVFWLS